MSMWGPACDGHGRIRCICGGEFCLCGEDGEECFGCKKCRPQDEPDYEPSDDDVEAEWRELEDRLADAEFIDRARHDAGEF